MRTRLQQLDDLLYLRLSPLKRFLLERHARMLTSSDFDEADYEEEVAKILRVERLIKAIKLRLYPETAGRSPLEIWADAPDDAPLPAYL